MKRTARDRRPSVSPVEQIELDERNTRSRTILLIIFILIGAVAFGTALFRLLPESAEWQELDALPSVDWPGAGEYSFVFGAQDGSTEERKWAQALYSELGAEIELLFDARESREGVHNVRYLCDHPNETVEVDPRLYAAFALLAERDCTAALAGPLYEIYEPIFYCTEDWEAALYDPRLGEDAAAYAAELLPFLQSDIEVELLGDDRLCLRMSESYLRFVRENGIERPLDFGWLKNAFVLDALGAELNAAGFTKGTLRSRDGFLRSLGESEAALPLYARTDGTIYLAGTVKLPSGSNAVSLLSFPVAEGDRSCVLQSGETRTAHIDIADGLCHDAYEQLTGVSDSRSCAEIALSLLPLQIAEEPDDEALAGLAREEISALFSRGDGLWYNDPDLVPGELYDREDRQFRAVPFGSVE